jgi:murein DD-endopeptidase MepM/ murein hydrolase activator NlpD
MGNDKQDSSGGEVFLRLLMQVGGIKGVLIVILILIFIVLLSAIGGVADKAGGQAEFEKVVNSTKGMTNDQVVALFTDVIEGRYAKKDEKLNWPVPFTRRITSPYAEIYDPSVGKKVLHEGIDIAAPQIADKAVVAVADAKVVAVDTAGTGKFGKWVQLDLKNGKQCLYAQLDDIRVRAGEDVSINQPLGKIAAKTSEGGMGPHLHFELKVNGKTVDPMPFFKDADKLGDAPPNPNGKFNWPVPTTRNIASLYGERVDPATGKPVFHGGIDIASSDIKGKPVVAIADARVISVNTNAASKPYGKNVLIEIGEAGSGILCFYAYLDEVLVSAGQEIKANQTIGTVGAKDKDILAGESTEPHLHFEINWGGHSVNPLPLLK